jgi:hypothetical protein
MIVGMDWWIHKFLKHLMIRIYDKNIWPSKIVQ